MKFILLWTEQVNEGTVTVTGRSGQATYRVNVPISVEQVSAENLGCPSNPLIVPTLTTGSVVIAPTANPIPSPTLVSDTPPGTILESGQWWKSNGVWATIDRIVLSPRSVEGYVGCYNKAFDIKFSVIFRNQTDATILFEFTKENINVRSNLAKFTMTCWDGGDTFSIGSRGEQDLTRVWYQGEIADSRVKEVFVTFSVSRAQNATWRIPIVH